MKSAWGNFEKRDWDKSLEKARDKQERGFKDWAKLDKSVSNAWEVREKKVRRAGL